MDPNNIAQPGNSTLLEVPMSIQYKHSGFLNAMTQMYDRLRGKQRSASVNWVRPKGGNLRQMESVVAKTLEEGSDYIEFMLHSSELMPGGSPTFSTEQHIETLYRDLDMFFAWLADKAEGKTLSGYYQEIKAV